MRLIRWAAVLLACTTACHDDKASVGDTPDARVPDDAGTDASPDASPDGGVVVVPDGIAEARAASAGSGLSLAIRGVTVTYLKPLIGNPPNDPVGFTIQAKKAGPALFVAVDPATLNPPAKVGDVVDFTISTKTVVAMQPRATAITGYARRNTGTDASLLAQDITSATDILAALDSYDSELLTVSGSLDEFSAAGVGFTRSTIHTTGLPASADYQIRFPSTFVDAIDLDKTCKFTARNVPMTRYNNLAQIGAYVASDLTLTGCPTPSVLSVTPQSATKIELALDRHALASSVKTDGSQFTFNNGLKATAAVVSGRNITLTTDAQSGATYTLTIAKTVTDLQGSSIGGNVVSFAGFGGTNNGNGAALSVHTTLGIPGPISTTAPSDYFVSVKPQYVVSYNGSRKIPNWVSWELNNSYLGAESRTDNYRPDDTFPGTEPQAALSDYSGSGYDRGHMCPSADRTLDKTSNDATFYLTNMIPQAANNNQGPWNNLENYTRGLLTGGKEIFIISGGIVTGSSKTVGNGLYVPDSTFKVIVVLDAVGQGASSVTTSTRVIAVIMPNDNALISKTADWKTFRVSVDSIEAQTGLDFLSDVSPTIQSVIEARVDNL